MSELYVCKEYEKGYRVISTIEKHNKIIYNQALGDVDDIITEQLDKSDNQVECQTLRWVLDILSDLIK